MKNRKILTGWRSVLGRAIAYPTVAYALLTAGNLAYAELKPETQLQPETKIEQVIQRQGLGLENKVENSQEQTQEQVQEIKTQGEKKEEKDYGNFKEFMKTHYSPNFNKQENRSINGIVLHTTEGSGLGAEEWLTKPESKASAHYLIMENGDIVQLVDDSNIAWHCRNYNPNTIGIEFAGYHNKPLNQTQIDRGKSLVSYLCDKYRLSKKDVHAHSELDSARRKDPGKENMNKILTGVN